MWVNLKAKEEMDLSDPKAKRQKASKYNLETLKQVREAIDANRQYVFHPQPAVEDFGQSDKETGKRGQVQ